MNLNGQKITVLGAGKSGIAAALLAASRGAEVFVSDMADMERFSGEINRMKKHGIDFEFGGHTEKIFQADLWILSPGIPLYSDPVKKALAKGIKVISEVEFASRMIRGKIIAITGSNGKSTTTEFTGRLLEALGYEVNIVGNIGLAVSALVEEKNTENTHWVIEMSSFQLETIEEFHPQVAVLLNMSPDHLDRYETAEEYYEAKARIFLNLSERDTAVLNGDDQTVLRYADKCKAKKKYFSVEKETDSYYSARKIKIGETEFSTKDIFLKGAHNYQNIMAAFLAVDSLGIPIEKDKTMELLKRFHGLPHRMEFVDEIDGVRFYNDSKATTIESMLAALNSFKEKVVLIAGGKNKGVDFSRVKDLVSAKVSKVFALGDAGDEIEEAWGKETQIEKSRDLREVVKKAFDEARQKGSVVLLSPACASFDMFRNFEERGDLFKKYVRELANGT